MNIIYNLRLRVKILVSFFILIAGMIVIGFLGISNMGSINDSSNFIYQNNFLSTTYIQTINNNISEVRLYTQKIVTAKYAGDLEENVKYLGEVANSTTENLAAYEKAITEDDDRELFARLKSDITTYRAERETVIQLARDGKFDEADEYNASTVIPAVLVVQDDIDALVAFNLNDAQSGIESSNASYNASVTSTIAIIAVVGILAVLLGVFISGMITTPLNAVRSVAEKIADGDLTPIIPQRYLKQKDEVGMLANNIEAMKQGLLNTVTGIKDSTDNLGGQVTSTNDTLTVLNERITDTSAATEELSASMEETGASAEEMNATAAEIERAVETVAEKAEEGANRSGEINSRAVELGRSINTSIEKSNSIFNEIKVTLERALEDSKAVDEINALADAILGITSQTTLLALNASIEAARAGEAGKGFAVVANEISALADNSKNTVTQIQAITKVVMNAVSALSSSSTNLLNFVANEVMNDYKGMQDSAVSYTDDATYMSDMTSDLSATSQELLASVQVLMRAISEVATAAQEGAKTTTVVAEQTTDISMNASTIVENMKQTQQTSDSLVGLVNKFKLQD